MSLSQILSTNGHKQNYCLTLLFHYWLKGLRYSIRHENILVPVEKTPPGSPPLSSQFADLFRELSNQGRNTQLRLRPSQTMKAFIFALIFAAMSGASLAEQVGVRVVFNRGLLESAEVACSFTEQTRISNALRLAVAPQRKLRSSNSAELPACSTPCQGFANGSCYLAANCRPLDGAAITVDDAFLDEELITYSPALQEQCREGKRAVVAVMKKELSTDLSRQCKSLLQKRIDMACHVL